MRRAARKLVRMTDTAAAFVERNAIEVRATEYPEITEFAGAGGTFNIRAVDCLRAALRRWGPTPANGYDRAARWHTVIGWMHREAAHENERAASRAARARAVAGIHALADWLAEHEDAPVPAFVTAYARISDPHGDQDTRAKAVVEWAHANDARLTETTADLTARVALIDTGYRGLRVGYNLATYLESAQYTARYAK